MRGAGQREEPSKLRSLTYRITILSLGLFGRGRLLWRHVPPKISAVAISLSTGVALALIFAFQPSPLEEAKSVSTPQLFVALATLIATMLVLSIT